MRAKIGCALLRIAFVLRAFFNFKKVSILMIETLFGYSGKKWKESLVHFKNISGEYQEEYQKYIRRVI